MKKLSVCILLLIFTLLLFSCTEKKEPIVIRENAYFRENVTELPEGISLNMNGSFKWDGERLCADAWRDIPEVEYAVESINISFLPDGSDLREESVSENGGNYSMYRLSDDIIADYSVIWEEDETPVCMLTVSEKKSQLFSVDFPELFAVSVTENSLMAGDVFMPNDALLAVSDKQELLLFATGKGVIALDKAGKTVWKSNSRNVIGLISVGNRLLCLTQNNGSQKLIEIYLNGTFGEEMVLPEELSAAGGSTLIVKDESGTFSFCVVTAVGVYGVSIEEDEKNGALSNVVTMLLNFADSDLYNGGYAWRILSPTHFVRLYYDWESGSYISVLTSDGKEAPEREILEMVILNTYVTDVSSKVTAYNRSQEQYRIHITDYTWMDADARKLKFDAEIASGNIPDLILLGENSNYDETVVTYERAGLFADLSKLLPSYDELLGSRTGPYRNQDGSQYVFPLRAFKDIRYANRDYLDGPSTVEELKKALEALPEGMQLDYNGYRNLSVSVLSSVYTDFIDTEKAVCSFDSPEFIDILTWLNECKKKPSESLLEDDILRKDDIRTWFREGKTLFADVGVSTVMDLIDTERELGDKAVPYGYPNVDRVLKLGFRIGDYLAISETSKHKDAAAAFIEYYMESSRPTDRKAKNVLLYNDVFFTESDVWDWYELVKGYTVVYTPATRSSVVVPNGEAEEMTGVKTQFTKESCQHYIDVCSSIEGSCEMFLPVWEMILEEFLLQESCDPAEAAKHIQSGASLYLSEQFG